MERKVNIILFILSLAMLLVLSYHDDCIFGEGSHAAEEPTVQLIIDTCWIHDTVRTASPVVVREVVREVPACVDTDAILSAYYTMRILSDTFHLRDMATVRITDTLYMNDIVGRQVNYDLAAIDVSYEMQQPRRVASPDLTFSAGIQLGREQAAVIAGLRHKRTELIGGYDLRLKAPCVILKHDLWQW